MTDELKPCPFCGGEAEINESTSGLPFFSIWCKNENCIAGAVQVRDFDKERLVNSWNTRNESEQERTCTFSTYTGNGDSYPTCSSCGYEADRYECEWLPDDSMNYIGKFCPNCGAKVVE